MKVCLTNDKERKLMINTEVLFRRLLAVSKYREIDMHEVLEYEPAGVPPSMFHDDGKMRKTKTSEIAGPVGHGWYMDNVNGLQPIFYTKESAPLEVRDVTHMYCTDKNCKGQNCQCLQAGLKCIEVCSCTSDCSNLFNKVSLDNTEDMEGEKDVDFD